MRNGEAAGRMSRGSSQTHTATVITINVYCSRTARVVRVTSRNISYVEVLKFVWRSITNIRNTHRRGRESQSE